MKYLETIAIFLLVVSRSCWTLADSPRVVEDADICEDSEGYCVVSPPRLVCGQSCIGSRTSAESLYHSGGAQAYKPDAPVKTSVCDISESHDKHKHRHKVATWPFSRSSRRLPPQLDIRVQLWSCAQPTRDDNKMSTDDCCCETLANPDHLATTKMEVWQARPDGTYSSISKGREEGDCRATVTVAEDGAVQFTTLAPGSTGSLGGLGPGGWDFSPYGPPVLHMLLTSQQYEPLLLHIPVLLNRDTLQQRSFWGPDLRGHAPPRRTSREKQQNGYQVNSWTKLSDTRVQIDMDVFLTTAAESVDLQNAMCPSYIYGLPSSFFVEPIAVCAPSLLDFFPL